jgi:hypothetical protein
MCKHIGLAQIKGNYGKALAHLSKVNGITLDEAEKYVRESFDIWEKRSQNNWELDIKILENENNG